MGKHRLRTLRDYLAYIDNLPPGKKRPSSPELESEIPINCHNARRYSFVKQNGGNIDISPIPASERETVSVPLWQHLEDRIVS